MSLKRISRITLGMAATVTAALLAGYTRGHLKAQTPTGDRESRSSQELRKILGATPKGAEGIPKALVAGTPEYVRRTAERYVQRKGRALVGEDAVQQVLNELRQAAAFSGQTENLDKAKSQLPKEAIVLVDHLLRPALKVCNDAINDAVPNIWLPKINTRNVDISRAMKPVGLISFANIPNAGPVGTGFLVAKNVVMTNRHVAEEFTRPDCSFKTHPQSQRPAAVTIDFVADYCNNNPNVHRISKVLHIEPEPGPDVALLQVEGADLPPPLDLQTAPPAGPLLGWDVYTVGYPFEDARNPADAQTEIFGTVFGVKRFSPGTLMDGSGSSLGGAEAFLFHDCSTLGGSSGSPLISIDQGRVVGIHFSGLFENKNWAWPMWRVLKVDKIRQIIEANRPVAGPRQPSGREATGNVSHALRLEGGASGKAAKRAGPQSFAADAMIHAPVRPVRTRTEELRDLLGVRQHQPGAEAALPRLQQGIPERVRVLASEQVYRKTGKYVGDEESVRMIFNNPALVADSRDRLMQVSDPVRTEVSGFIGVDVGRKNPFSNVGVFQVASHTRVQLGIAEFRPLLTRPALFVCDDRIEDKVPPNWLPELQNGLARIVRTSRSTCLITCENDIPEARSGSGFVVGKNLVMTNRHIAESFVTKEADGTWQFKTESGRGGKPAEVFVDFRKYNCPVESLKYPVTAVLYIEPEPGPDVALLEVKTLDNDKHPLLTLARAELKESELKDRKVYIVGYPFDDPEVPSEVVRKLFFEPLGVKRLQPGTLIEKNQVDQLVHDCSTLAGNSGSSLSDLQTGEVIGIHFFGEPSPPYYNQAVPAWKVWNIPAIAARLAANLSAGDSSRLASGDHADSR